MNTHSLVKTIISLSLASVLPGHLPGQVLTHGPVVGGVTESKAKIFVRTNQAASVKIRYSTDPLFGSYRESKPFITSAKNSFTGIIQVTRLTPETTYYLNPIVNGQPQLSSNYPYFTTFARAGTSRTFTFVALSDFASCSTLTHPVQTFTYAAAENPAFVFIGGDFDHRNPVTLNEKRHMFQNLYDPATPYMGNFVDCILHRSAIIHQWDDHDAGVNNADKTYPAWNLSQEIFEEYVPSYALPAVKPGIWQKFSYAQMDGFVLDCRSQRDREQDYDDADKSMLDGNALGATGQLQWLEDNLLDSTAVWKVIFSSVVTNPTTKFPDGWAGYKTEWNALRDFIQSNNITGVVFITGDLHLGAIDNGTASGFPEMCLSQANGTGSCPTDGYGIWSEGYYQDPTCTGYGVVTVLQDPDRLVLQAKDEFGDTDISYTVTAGQCPGK